MQWNSGCNVKLPQQPYFVDQSLIMDYMGEGDTAYYNVNHLKSSCGGV